MAIIDYYAVDEPNYLKFLHYDIDSVMNHYSTFLHDGDYEHWQPYTNGKELTKEDRQELTRYAWILNRFTKYGSKDWYDLHNIFMSYFHTP